MISNIALRARGKRYKWTHSRGAGTLVSNYSAISWVGANYMYIKVEDTPTHPNLSLTTIYSSILWVLQWTIYPMLHLWLPFHLCLLAFIHINLLHPWFQAPHLFISLTTHSQSYFQFHLNIFCNRRLSAGDGRWLPGTLTSPSPSSFKKTAPSPSGPRTDGRDGWFHCLRFSWPTANTALIRLSAQLRARALNLLEVVRITDLPRSAGRTLLWAFSPFRLWCLLPFYLCLSTLPRWLPLEGWRTLPPTIVYIDIRSPPHPRHHKSKATATSSTQLISSIPQWPG